jgi:TatD DNase family protein
MGEIKYIDAHSHIHFPQFEQDREEVLARMKEAGVSTITVGCDRATSFAARDFAHAHGFYATAGLHPSDNRAEPLDEEGIRELLSDERVVAVGECGLDYSRLPAGKAGLEDESEKERQRDIFRRQVALAVAADKPVMIHCRASGKDSEQRTDAHDDCLAILKQFPGVRPILHFFTASPEVAARYQELDAYFSFSGVITFASMYEKTVQAVPLDRILVETDAPYAAPVPHRGKRNEPVFAIDTLKHVALLRGIDEEVFRLQMLANMKAAFKLP